MMVMWPLILLLLETVAAETTSYRSDEFRDVKASFEVDPDARTEVARSFDEIGGSGGVPTAPDPDLPLSSQLESALDALKTQTTNGKELKQKLDELGRVCDEAHKKLRESESIVLAKVCVLAWKGTITLFLIILSPPGQDH